METTIVSIFLIAMASLGTSVISGVIGMGGGVTLIALMGLIIPFTTLIPLHGIIQLVSNSSRAFFLRDKIKKEIFIPMVCGIPFGVIPAVYLIKNIENKDHFLLLLVILIAYVLFKPKKFPEIKIPFWAFSFVGAMAGFMGMLIGATGPLIAVFFLRDDITKEEIVATKAMSQTVVHFSKIPAFLAIGFNYTEYLIPIAIFSFAAILGTKLGTILLQRVNEKLFKRIYTTVLFLSGLRILYKVIF